jgi:hypothetical protein
MRSLTFARATTCSTRGGLFWPVVCSAVCQLALAHDCKCTPISTLALPKCSECRGQAYYPTPSLGFEHLHARRSYVQTISNALRTWPCGSCHRIAGFTVAVCSILLASSFLVACRCAARNLRCDHYRPDSVCVQLMQSGTSAVSRSAEDREHAQRCAQLFGQIYAALVTSVIGYAALSCLKYVATGNGVLPPAARRARAVLPRSEGGVCGADAHSAAARGCGPRPRRPGAHYSGVHCLGARRM